MTEKEAQFEKWWNSDLSKFWPDRRHKNLAFVCWLAGYEEGREKGRESGLADGEEVGFWTGVDLHD